VAFQRYLAEQVAVDHADGAFSRREALRRLALLGVGGPASSTTGAAAMPPGTGPRYHPDAAVQAYAKVLDWFGRHLGWFRPRIAPGACRPR
jgi:fermentation-respiration switch protein FrsA (DUF1100 family)